MYVHNASRGAAYADDPLLLAGGGLGTFALSGLALSVAGCLIVRWRALPLDLGYLAFPASALRVFVYVGRHRASSATRRPSPIITLPVSRSSR